MTLLLKNTDNLPSDAVRDLLVQEERPLQAEEEQDRSGGGRRFSPTHSFLEELFLLNLKHFSAMKDGRFLVTEQCSPHKREFFDKYLSPPQKKVCLLLLLLFSFSSEKSVRSGVWPFFLRWVAWLFSVVFILGGAFYVFAFAVTVNPYTAFEFPNFLYIFNLNIVPGGKRGDLPVGDGHDLLLPLLRLHTIPDIREQKKSTMCLPQKYT